MKPDSPTVTAADVARLLGVTNSTIASYVADGTIKGTQAGKNKRISIPRSEYNRLEKELKGGSR